jgi:two-component sensor histidine kinase
VVADNGVGLPPDLDIHQTDSLGMQLVGTFTEQLDASLSLERAGGTAFHLRFNELAYRRRF